MGFVIMVQVGLALVSALEFSWLGSDLLRLGHGAAPQSCAGTVGIRLRR